jgi:hypothetical protein
MNAPDYKKPIKFNEDGFMQLMKENFHIRTENVNQLREIRDLTKQLLECKDNTNNVPVRPAK